MNVARNLYNGVDWTIWLIGWLLCLPLRIVYTLVRRTSPELVSSFQPKKKRAKTFGPSPDQQTSIFCLQNAVKDTNIAAKLRIRDKTRADASEARCKALQEENAKQSQRIKQLENSLRNEVKDKDESLKDIENEKDKITEEAKSLCQQVKTKDDSIKSLQEDRDHVADVLKAAQEEVTGLRNEVKDKDVSLKDIENEKDKITEEAKSLCQQVKTKDDSIKSLQEDRDHVADVLKAAQEEVTGLCQQVKTKDDSIKSLQEDRDHVADVLKAVQQEVTGLRNEVNDKDVSLKDIQNEKDKITEEAKSLRKKESESKKQIEGLKKERDDKQKKLGQSENRIIKLKESFSKKESECRKQIKALRRERDNKQNQLRQSEGQITKLKESLPRKDSESRKQIEALTKERDDKQNQLRQSEDQMTKLKESLHRKESESRKQIEGLKKKRDDQQKKLRQSESQITNLRESLCQQIKTKDDSIKSLQEDRDHFADVLKAAEEEVAGFKNQIASLQEELEKHDAVMQENRQLTVALNEKEHIIKENEMVLRDAEDAKEDALSRLSQSVSLRLRDNNPNIVDLSDMYRPSKLAEMMSELYDNQWTDAFTYLEENWGHGNTFSETECIEFLLNVLMEINTFCLSKITNDWTDGLEKILLTAKPNDEAEVVKMLKDIRKKNALTQIPNVEKMCVSVLQNTELVEDSSFSKHLLQDKLYEYLQECVKLCLLMAVQDPPVCLVCEGWKTRQTIKGESPCPPADSTSDIIPNGTVEKRKEFDRGSYKEYTKRGKFIEYIVWPLIYLHDNGPILSKGVAQGCDTSTIPPHDDL